MTDYKRFISYMYMYKKGEKGNNVGFAKIEARNNNCKFIVNVKSHKLKNKIWKVLLFYRGEGVENSRKIIPIYIDELEIIKDEFMKTYVTKVDNLFASNIELGKIVGVILVNNNKEYIGTEWDDNGIDYEEIKLVSNDFINENEVEKNKDKRTDVIDNVEQIEKTKIDNENILIEDFIIEDNINFKNNITNIKNNNKTIADNIINTEKDNVINVEKDNVINTEKDTKIITDNITNNSVSKQMKIEQEIKPYIKRIFNGFPGMYPFEDDEIIDCVKLEPHDIGVFPMDKWSLANNSFLLHGYYTYRHLIFARMKNNNKVRYILGVPGIFRDREKFMAKMFGFNNFKGVRNKPLDVGEFGYWYMYFNL